jgi:hypothetical protein
MNPEDPEIMVLQNAIVEMICEQPSWGGKMPKPWIHLEMVINKKDILVTSSKMYARCSSTCS